jgi:hypothetical protein
MCPPSEPGGLWPAGDDEESTGGADVSALIAGGYRRIFLR